MSGRATTIDSPTYGGSCTAVSDLAGKSFSDIVAALGEADDSSQTDPAQTATLIALMKGVIVQNQQIITLLTSLDTQINNGITVSIG